MSAPRYAKYPFIADLERLFSGDLRLDLLLESEEISHSIRECFTSIVERGEFPGFKCSSEISCALEYLVFLAILRITGNRWFQSKVCVSFSKHVSRQLSEDSKRDPSLIAYIASRLGLGVEYQRSPRVKIPYITENEWRGKRKTSVSLRPLNYSIRLVDFLSIVSKRLSQDPRYNPSNQVIHEGRVYVTGDILIRLIEEYVAKYTCDLINSDYIGELAEWASVKKIYEGLNETLSKILSQQKGAFGDSAAPGKLVYDALPPCISRILDIMKTGGNPSHIERFTAAAFLVHVGLDTEEILDFFRNTADFDEKIARYQIEHIAGKKGGGKKYLPHRCEKLKSSGVCPIAEYCKGGRNPLRVYYYNLRKGRVEGRKSGKELNKSRTPEEDSFAEDMDEE